jgi:hypothetical protein
VRKLHPDLPGVIALAAAIAVAGCGRGDSAVSPSPLPGGSTSSISGTVVQIVSNEPIASARVTGSFGGATTGADGTFTITPAATVTLPVRLTVEAAGFITRELNVRLETGGRRDLVIDLMGRPPFALPFYEEFARDRLDNRGQLRALTPVASPRYVVITRYTNGGTVPASLVDRVRTSVSEIAQAFSDGRASPQITTADTPPSNNSGQIVITFTQDSGSAMCGQASVGVESGFVRFYTGVAACACSTSEDGLAPVIIRHELAHTLGAFHVSDDAALMNAQPRCSAMATALERFHAAVLFRRPRGNMAPDVDPPGALAQVAGPDPSTCRVSGIR